MSAELSRLRSPAAVSAALAEFSHLGRLAFLARYGYGKSRDYLVRNPVTGELCDSKAIAGAAFGYQFPQEGPLKPGDFSGGEATVVPKLQSLGFEVVRLGEDWSPQEVQATVRAYFEMLRLESQQASYKKTDFNAHLRQQLRGRSKASVERQWQHLSAVLHNMELPFVPDYNPRNNAPLLLRQATQQFVLDHAELIHKIVDAMEEVKLPVQKTFKAVVVQPPPIALVAKIAGTSPRERLPRKIDYAARDEVNRRLGRAGEQWAIDFEHHRLVDTGQADMVQRLDWISERLGDGAGYDILSYDTPSEPRYIEVKTTNGGHASHFIVSRNELDFSREVGDAFFLYRIFQFRESPSLYMLRGDVSRQVHLEPIDYRASFRRLVT